MTHDYPAWESGPPDLTPPPRKPLNEPRAKVLVEAPMMNHVEPAAPPASAPTAAEVRLQTADTMKLEPVDDEPEAETADLDLRETFAAEPLTSAVGDYETVTSHQPAPAEFSFRDLNEPVATAKTMAASAAPAGPTASTAQSASAASAVSFDDSVLDLEEEYVGEPQIAEDDVFLDLDFEDTTPAENGAYRASAETIVLDQTIPVEPPAKAESTSEVWMVSPEELPVRPAAVAAPVPVPAVSAGVQPAADSELSAAAIDAIARRVVELMSDKVVREIAWEVVPELSELLIRQKLNEKK